MSSPARGVSVVFRRAIANLLRLADSDLRDARVLMRNSSLRNGAMLAWSSVSHMTAATVVPEQGLPADPSSMELGALDESNPVRARLKALQAGSYRERGLLPDGRLPKAPDETALRDHIERAVALLEYLSEHFEVDLDSEEPAGTVSPVRPMPPPEPSAAPIAQADVPPLTPAPGEPSRHRKPGEAAPDPANRLVRPKRHKVPAAPAPTSPPKPAPEPPPSAGRVASTVFWSLMDRWGVADLDALALLGHAGGLTQKGTRPRFKLTGAENEMMAQLQDVDGALDALGLDPRKWLREPLLGAPFFGADPITFITQHQAPGTCELRHYILQQGLRLSLQQL